MLPYGASDEQTGRQDWVCHLTLATAMIMSVFLLSSINDFAEYIVIVFSLYPVWGIHTRKHCSGSHIEHRCVLSVLMMVTALQMTNRPSKTALWLKTIFCNVDNTSWKKNEGSLWTGNCAINKGIMVSISKYAQTSQKHGYLIKKKSNASQ